MREERLASEGTWMAACYNFPEIEVLAELLCLAFMSQVPSYDEEEAALL